MVRSWQRAVTRHRFSVTSHAYSDVMWLTMKRLQIMIDEDLDVELARLAKAERRSKASIIRETLRQRFRSLPPLEDDPIWEMVGADVDAEPVADVDEHLVELIGRKSAKPE